MLHSVIKESTKCRLKEIVERTQRRNSGVEKYSRKGTQITSGSIADLSRKKKSALRVG